MRRSEHHHVEPTTSENQNLIVIVVSVATHSEKEMTDKQSNHTELVSAEASRLRVKEDAIYKKKPTCNCDALKPTLYYQHRTELVSAEASRLRAKAETIYNKKPTCNCAQRWSPPYITISYRARLSLSFTIKSQGRTQSARRQPTSNNDQWRLNQATRQESTLEDDFNANRDIYSKQLPRPTTAQ